MLGWTGTRAYDGVVVGVSGGGDGGSVVELKTGAAVVVFTVVVGRRRRCRGRQGCAGTAVQQFVEVLEHVFYGRSRVLFNWRALLLGPFFQFLLKIFTPPLLPLR